jgi:hypothetical protein
MDSKPVQENSKGPSSQRKKPPKEIKKVNITSWHKRDEIRQLSNFGEADLLIVLTVDDLHGLGFSEQETAEAAQDGVISIRCTSVEGFIQGLKAKEPAKQREIFSLSGNEAKSAGKMIEAEYSEMGRLIFFLGRKFRYLSVEHRALIEYCIWQKYVQDTVSADALIWTKKATLTHNLGKFDGKPGKTTLPKQVFTRILREARAMLRGLKTIPSFKEILASIKEDGRNESIYYIPQE